MSYAFEVTQDDVENVLNSHNVKYNESDIENIMEVIDDSAISESALSVDFDGSEDENDILDKQTEAAYDEIAIQLYQGGIIEKWQIEKYGNKNILNLVED